MFPESASLWLSSCLASGREVGAITWPMNSSWAQSVVLVLWAFLWRKHPPWNHPSLWFGISHRESSIFASEHGETEISQWGCSWIGSYSKDRSWLVLDLLVCWNGKIQASTHQPQWELWGGLCRTWSIYKWNRDPVWPWRSPDGVSNSKLKSLWRLSIYEALCTHKVNVNHLSSKLTISR